ncbi:MAG: DUF1223 domain-containing protein [Dongiaceae bacterium]
MAAGVVVALGPGDARGGDAPAPGVVVELFTSQGCSSCPPADALLGELARRPDIVALAFHVDYWDYIGWKDPFATPVATQRQRAYAGALRVRMVYTPQMVVDGRIDAVGSDRRAVETAIATAVGSPKLSVVVEGDGRGGRRAVIPAAEGVYDGGQAVVWLAVLDTEAETGVMRGENSGRTLKEFNIVREWRRIGIWDGTAVTIPLDMVAAADRDACAVVVQSGPVGPILGAAFVKLGDDQM